MISAFDSASELQTHADATHAREALRNALKIKRDQAIAKQAADMAAKAAVEADACRIAPAMFATGDASKVVGRITGAVSPAASLARVWACWADTGTPITCADADPADGRFTIGDVPVGQYFLRVTAGGYEPIEDREALCKVKPGAAAEAAPITLARRPR